jgi:3-phenylpropionate/trans-cinnamate dioxygenase ferredoxin reductase subunit
MNGTQDVVVVGAALAGARAVEALREEGHEGSITLVGSEPHLPYERPPLSKGYLLGTADRDSVFVHPESWYAEHDVRLRRSTRATVLDRAAHEVLLDDAERLHYDRLLLTTGALPRPLTVPGAEELRPHYLRTLGDSEALKNAFAAAARVVVVGAGWIGLEAAAAARAAGAEVVVLESAELPLLRVLGPETARVFADLHREHGVDLRGGVRITAAHAGDRPGAGTLVLADGTHVTGDVVLVGIGVTPDDSLARAAGLEVDDGIAVDSSLQTVDPAVFAAGDVANAFHPLYGRRIRVEHWANALHQPVVAARAMLGRPARYERLPYFFTDQYDLGMEYTGYAAPGAYDRVVVRGDLAAREFIAFWLAAGVVLAGMNVNVWDVTGPIGDLVRSGRPVDPARLADPDVALTDLLPAS